jgi:hypothetical protein
MPVVALKLALVAAAATVTEAGTVSAELPEERATADPPLGAPLERVTVQVLLAFEARLGGLQASEVTVIGGAVRLIEAVAELPLRTAVITAV